MLGSQYYNCLSFGFVFFSHLALSGVKLVHYLSSLFEICIVRIAIIQSRNCAYLPSLIR